MRIIAQLLDNRRMKPELTRRFEAYTNELAQALGHRESRIADEVPLDMKGYQVALNGAGVIMRFGAPLDLDTLATLRTYVDAFGMYQDVTVAEACAEADRVGQGGWTDPELETVRNGYRREMGIFEKHFPRDRFPQIYQQSTV